MRSVWLATLCSATVAAACGGCGDDGSGTPDGEPLDACTITCSDAPDDTLFTGELVDWDSTPTLFMGVPGAVYTLRGAPTRTSTTAPNGRFMLMIPSGVDAIVDIDAPDVGAVTGYTDAIHFVQAEVIVSSTAVFSSRTFAAARRDMFYMDTVGNDFDAGAGHVLIYQSFDNANLTLTGNGTAFATEDGTVWAAGSDGAYVLFANVDVGIGTQTLGGPGNLVGGGEIPVEAGKLTFVTTIFALE